MPFGGGVVDDGYYNIQEAPGIGYGNSSGNNNRGGGGAGSGGSSSYSKSMSREQQQLWFNNQVRSRDAFFDHPAGAAFRSFVIGGAVLGALDVLGAPVVIDGIIGDVMALFRVTQKTEGSIKTYEQSVAEAKQAYPNLANKPNHSHHITPQYLGGDKNGLTVPLDPAYHQRITNEFRKAWPYGQGKPNPVQLERIKHDVYNQYPLPPGY